MVISLTMLANSKLDSIVQWLLQFKGVNIFETLYGSFLPIPTPESRNIVFGELNLLRKQFLQIKGMIQNNAVLFAPKLRGFV